MITANDKHTHRGKTDYLHTHAQYNYANRTYNYVTWLVVAVMNNNYNNCSGYCYVCEAFVVYSPISCNVLFAIPSLDWYTVYTG